MNCRARRAHTVLGSMLVSALLAGCDSGTAPFCTTDFRAISFTLVDTLGAPVSDATVTRVLLRTGEILTPTPVGQTAPGTYVVVDDGSKAKLQADGDSIGVGITPVSGTSIEAYYVVTVPGGCHVNKVSGGDTFLVF
jgi:hypothetical protein